jgi:hypothetical protein
MSYRIHLSHSRVAWYDQDVERIIDAARRQGVKLNDVRLNDLEAGGKTGR